MLRKILQDIFMYIYFYKWYVLLQLNVYDFCFFSSSLRVRVYGESESSRRWWHLFYYI